jgi:hypothetical protein
MKARRIASYTGLVPGIKPVCCVHGISFIDIARSVVNHLFQESDRPSDLLATGNLTLCRTVPANTVGTVYDLIRNLPLTPHLDR